jgi:dUTP pyrophosphatase
MNTELKIKLLDNGIMPTRGSEEAAGWDLYSVEPTTIVPAGETVKFNTGISIELPKNTFGGIFPRSGLATKCGLACANAVGVIDSDYRGPVIVALHNHSSEDATVSYGDRIAQLIVIPYVPVDLVTVSELSDTERGKGGFGSTGA